jgi:GntR family transcriptional regulator, transcriptional repressor for pyruvate dehydrogenase complex
MADMDNRGHTAAGNGRAKPVRKTAVTPLRRRPRGKRYDATGEVIERIKGMIKSGALSPGDKLHSEIRFAADLGVSRSAVTKAYAKLEAYGLIRTVPQSGTYLVSIGSDALIELLSNVLETNAVTVDSADIDTLYRLRALVEELIAVSVVETASDAMLSRLKQRAEAVKRKLLDREGGIEDDLTFHMEIAELSQKPFFKSLLFFITLPMVQAFRTFAKGKAGPVMKQRWKAAMAEHDAIVDAILARDVERTRRAVRRHFENSIKFNN